MAFKIRRVEYFYATVKDEPGESYQILSRLEGLGINLLAFTAVPVGPNATQLALFPEDSATLLRETQKAGLKIDGPHPAFLVQGDDELGALAKVHHVLFQARVNVYASMGVSDGKGSYGYLIYVRPEAIDRAAKALGL
ncbi:MAG: hypothetical protein KDC43_09070 [Saprospiraceae bacterium]|nr:hypothetical protein [Saprospiraceae bacterium]MCB0624043.1 hypothetical protein [Saprospiraceae bacterium]MCB0675876.1 hypothetical protein [Saprospiraceae bacterium]MCB0682737.1 hypothetical protein [Saprospiraceae bacterium]